MRRIRVRPSKHASAMGMIVGIVFVGIGLFVVIPIFGGFGIFWTLVAALIAVFHAVNVFSTRGVPTTEIDFDGEPLSTASPESPSFDERLRKLERLRTDGLISESEFQEKRRAIMEEPW